MEIKVKHQGQVVGLIDFDVSGAITNMRKIGFASFTVRSEVIKYEHFALFMDEESGDYIKFYPDTRFKVKNECPLTYDVLVTIKNILEHCISYHANEEESEYHEKKESK